MRNGRHVSLSRNDPSEAFLNKIVDIAGKTLKSSEPAQEKHYGTLGLLRQKFSCNGGNFNLVQYLPDHDLNEKTVLDYKKNRFTVIPELTYSPHIQKGAESSKRYRIDFVFFINGIPIATMELKSEFKQDIQDAIKQYKETRLPKDSITNKEEPLLKFRRGAIVHFAVTQQEVYMTTKLDGSKTLFLPFNRGTSEGGSGNDIPNQGYATSYLWEEILQKDNLLRILGRYVHLEIKDKQRIDGTNYKTESIVFPRYHQWDVVNRLLNSLQEEGVGHKYLIQHSAGSGKSNSIAWLSHQIATLYTRDGKKFFQSVIVVTDRNVLDQQLQDTIYQFEHPDKMIAKITSEKGGSKSSKLKSALELAQGIIIVTIQTFPHVLDEIRRSTTLSGKNFAIIADEAHSSQTGRTASQVRQVLLAEKMEENEDENFTAEDLLELAVRAKEGKGTISYFAFTATPKDKTLQLFGRPPKANPNGMPVAFHTYTMKQAIEEGFILDVLYNYVNYKETYELVLKNKEKVDQEVEKKKASKQVMKWVKLHPTAIKQKIEIIIHHFQMYVKDSLQGQAKAMIVTGSRLEAVKYKLFLDEYLGENKIQDIRALVAFSGEVESTDLPVTNKKYTESNMNGVLKGKDIRKAFDGDDFSVLIVANKFQTGFDQPKLCAMYIDKVVAGIECVQTFSRLNRTYPGKDRTKVFILDFTNSTEDVLNSFQPYFKNATVTSLSDVNSVYDLKIKLDSSGYYTFSQVDEFIESFYDKKKKNEDLIRICQPSVEKWEEKYRDSIENINRAKHEINLCKKNKNTVGEENHKTQLKEYEKIKSELDNFKKELGTYSRFYEFISQVVPLNDIELEKLSIFARVLQGYLRSLNISDSIDLSNLEFKYYKIKQLEKQKLELENEDGELEPSSVKEGIARAKERTLLSEIISNLNDLFGDEFNTRENIEHVYQLTNRVIENETAMNQIKNNDENQIMYGDLPEIVDDSFLDIDKINDKKKTIYLSNDDVREKIHQTNLQSC
jgi:type I restriction enzyme, R subunit